MSSFYQPQPSSDLPFAITGADGVEIAISEQALLSQINIIGDPIAERAAMHGNIIEKALEDGKQVAIVVDSNAYAGIVEPNGAGGKGYDVATIGAGNPGADIDREDGPLIARVIIETGISVMINVQGLSSEGMSNVVFEKNDVLSGMTRRERGMLYGFASLSGTLPRKRMNTDSRAVATTNCFADRAYQLNVGIVNVMTGAREVPLEFDQKAKNTIAMVNTGAKIQQDLASRIGPRFSMQILANALNSFGIGRSGITHGTYFNPGDLDPAGPYIKTVKPMKSKLGTTPSPTRKLNKATIAFMKALKKLRKERDDQRRKAQEKKVEQAELDRAHRMSIRRGISGRPAVSVLSDLNAIATGAKPRTSSGATRAYVIANRAMHAQEIDAIPSHVMRGAIAIATASRTARQMKACVEVEASRILELSTDRDVVAFSNRVNALIQRCRITPNRGFVTAMHLVEQDDVEVARRFVAEFTRNVDAQSPVGRTVAAMNDRSRRMTQHQTADIVLQAYIAFRGGRTIEAFDRNRMLPLLRSTPVETVVRAANDDVQDLANAA